MSGSLRPLLLNIFSATWSKISGTGIRLLQVPILLSALGVDDYGRWLLLSSVPTWLSLANFGFANVASNQISMAVSESNLDRAREVFSTTLLILFAIAAVFVPVCLIAANFLPWDRLIGTSPSRQNECALAAGILAVSIFISFSEELFGGRLRAARKTHLAILLYSIRPWVELIALVVCLNFSKSFAALATSSVVTTLCFIFISATVSRRLMPSIQFRLGAFNRNEIRSIFTKGIAFQAFPLSNALTFQGTLFVIQSTLGPAAVATFATARTVIRTVSQLIEILNQSTWSEFSHLMGAADFRRMAILHRTALAIAIFSSTIGAICLLIFGPWLYGVWLGKALVVDRDLFAFFVMAIPLNALYTTTSTVHMASNQHSELAIRYLIATSLSLMLCYVLSSHFGLAGAAVSVCLTDFLMLPYAITRSIVITHDTQNRFWRRVGGEFLNLSGLIQFNIRRLLNGIK